MKPEISVFWENLYRSSGFSICQLASVYVYLLSNCILVIIYSQILLEECQYEQEKIKIENLFDGDLEKILSDESGSESDEFNE